MGVVFLSDVELVVMETGEVADHHPLDQGGVADQELRLVHTVHPNHVVVRVFTGKL